MLTRSHCLALIKLSCVSFLFSTIAFAASNDWMSQIEETTPLSRITIPGTHNSGADAYEPFPGTAICQNASLTQQLGFGVRFLDMRCRHTSDSFDIYHGSTDQRLTFAAALTEVYAFLSANPSECVLMSVKEEHTASGNTRSFEHTFDSYVAANPEKWCLESSVPNLTEVRGKILLVRRFSSAQAKGIDGSFWADNQTFTTNNLRVQDHYVVPDNAAKWTHITAGFNAASADNDNAILHLNFASGYKSGLFGIPSIPSISNVINPQLDTHFTGLTQGQYGCVIMDFATAARCQLIYAANPATNTDMDGVSILGTK